MQLNAFIDGSITGGAWGKDKDTIPHAWAGWIVKNYLNIPIKWMSWDMGAGPTMSGNVAEYGALRSALNWITQEFPLASVNIYSDSQLVVNQMTNKYNCTKPLLIKWRNECIRLASKFPIVNYHWIPRELNKEADLLSKALQDKYGAKSVESHEELITRLHAKRINK